MFTDSESAPSVVDALATLNWIPKELGKIVTVLEENSTYVCVYFYGTLVWKDTNYRGEDLVTEEEKIEQQLSPNQLRAWNSASGKMLFRN